MERHILAREVTYVLPVKSFAIRTESLDRQEVYLALLMQKFYRKKKKVFLITRLFPSEPLDA